MVILNCKQMFENQNDIQRRLENAKLFSLNCKCIYKDYGITSKIDFSNQ